MPATARGCVVTELVFSEADASNLRFNLNNLQPQLDSRQTWLLSGTRARPNVFAQIKQDRTCMNLQIDPCNIAAEASSLINLFTFLATSESDELDARLDRTSVTQHRFRNQSTLGRRWHVRQHPLCPTTRKHRASRACVNFP